MPSSARLSRFVRPFAVPAVLALCGVMTGAIAPSVFAQARADRPTDRGMYVSVLDKNGAPVTGLTAADFSVREDGVVREVVRAEKATTPITLVILVDTSQAATPYIPDVRRALAAFVKRMAGPNRIAIMGFGERPTTLVGYTRDVGLLEKGVDRIFPISGSGSYLLQAVDEACEGLAKQDVERPVILAITAGGQEFSDRDYEQPLSVVKKSGATFDAMVFNLESPNVANFGQRNREMFLDAATSATGGQRVLLLSSMALDGALAGLADELANQYQITYARPESLVPPKKIEVTVQRPDLTARGTPILVRPR
jgi:VWFA-related protein